MGMSSNLLLKNGIKEFLSSEVKRPATRKYLNLFGIFVYYINKRKLHIHLQGSLDVSEFLNTTI